VANITVTAAAGANGAVVNYPTAYAKDVVDGNNVPLIYQTPSGSFFSLGTSTVLYNAKDAAGNQSDSKSFTVTVNAPADTTPPVLPNLPDITVYATSANGAAVTYGPFTATDNVDGKAVPVVLSKASGTTFPIGTTPVSYSATDAAGNTATSKTFNVVVVVPWNGIQQPVDANGNSLFKINSTIPWKFAGIAGLHATIVFTQSDNSPDGTDVEAINSNPADTGNVFRYDATTGTYQYNQGTKNMAAGDWYAHIDLGDHVDHAIKFSLRK
jgi:hypothetical protein